MRHQWCLTHPTKLAPGRSVMLQTQLIYCGDNLQKLKELPDECVDLIYIDPPFNSNRNYEVFWGDNQEKRAFDDRFGAVGDYISWIRPRVMEMYRVLKKTGSFYYHCDWHADAYVRVMFLPLPLLPFITERHFWISYFWNDWFDLKRDQKPENWRAWSRNYPELNGLDIWFRFTEECSLVLRLEASLGYITLSFADRDIQSPEEIARDDQAHWCPHVLRWDELDLIGRCTASRDRSLYHPGIPLLLLYRFAPICVGEETAERFAKLTEAWRSLDIFDDREIERFVRRFDCRDRSFTWIHDAQFGWTLHQEKAWSGLYTTRGPRGGFPFENFQGAIEEAKEWELRVRQPVPGDPSIIPRSP